MSSKRELRRRKDEDDEGMVYLSLHVGRRASVRAALGTCDCLQISRRALGVASGLCYHGNRILISYHDNTSKATLQERLSRKQKNKKKLWRKDIKKLLMV